MDSSDDDKNVCQFERNVKALRVQQIKLAKLQADYANQILILESKHNNYLAPFYKKRRQIICGEYEPMDDEINIPLVSAELEYEQENDMSDEIPKGIPNFWLRVLYNSPVTCDLIAPCDHTPLEYLINISCINHSYPDPGFTLQFHFKINPFFRNIILTKQYFIALDKKINDPFNAVTPLITDYAGCVIDWKGTNLTLKRRKNQTFKQKSFFNFFDPPQKTSDPFYQPYIYNYLMKDFEYAKYIKQVIIPKPLLYYYLRCEFILIRALETIKVIKKKIKSAWWNSMKYSRDILKNNKYLAEKNKLWLNHLTKNFKPRIKCKKNQENVTERLEKAKSDGEDKDDLEEEEPIVIFVEGKNEKLEEMRKKRKSEKQLSSGDKLESGGNEEIESICIPVDIREFGVNCDKMFEEFCNEFNLDKGKFRRYK